MADWYRKKPVVVEAMRLDEDNAKDVCAWVCQRVATVPVSHQPDGTVIIGTLEGDMRADIGDWVIRGVDSDFYPCKPWIFAATYDPALDDDDEDDDWADRD